MLKQLRQTIVQKLWETYCHITPDMQLIKTALEQKEITHHPLDHFAVIDLPGTHTGILPLAQVFSAVGYNEQGKDYLAEKQNDFLWMAEANCKDLPAQDVLPQVVVADFRLDEMPSEIQTIIHHYSSQVKSSPVDDIKRLSQQVAAGEYAALKPCASLILNYLSGRDWAIPTMKEFYAVREFNELLAWVLVFGRRPNHFTLSIHLLDYFKNLNDFQKFVKNEVKLSLNQEGGVIKGGIKTGIAQGSTCGITQTVPLADGNVILPTGFVEFVWRFPKNPAHTPQKWAEYFTGFVANHADKVIESLYSTSQP